MVKSIKKSKKGHLEYCSCCICKNIRGETKGKNHPSFRKKFSFEIRQKFGKTNRGKTKENCEYIRRALATRKKNFEMDNRQLLRHDYTGEIVGYLKIIKRIENQSIEKIVRVYWECMCVCGKTITTTSRNLRRGQKSCGCRSKSTRFSKTLSTIDGVLSRIMYHYKQHAAHRKLSWELSREETLNLFRKRCYYCGGEGRQLPNYLIKLLPEEYKNFKINGIDRADNDIGYTIKNSTPCCSICNRAKLDLSKENFLSWIDELIKFRKSVIIV